jgi:hypothetical protein
MNRLVEIKKASLLRAYRAYKKAEAEGTLVRVSLTEEQRRIIQ